jgi:hypothetical protein
MLVRVSKPYLRYSLFLHLSEENTISDSNPRGSITLPSDFHFGHLRPDQNKPEAPAPPPPLGPLSAFVGDFVGNGFNTIFRPDSTARPTPLPNPAPAPPPPRDNILELNLTSETLSFSKTLGSVPNRGTGTQPDAFLNGVPYLQTINDITSMGKRSGSISNLECGFTCPRPPFHRWAKRSPVWPPYLTAQPSRLRVLWIRQSLDRRYRRIRYNPIINATGKPFRFRARPLQTPTPQESRRIWLRLLLAGPSRRPCWMIPTVCCGISSTSKRS